MDEVSVDIAIPILIWKCEKENLPFSSLLEGVPYSEIFLRSKRKRMSWEGYSRLMENVSNRWSEEELITLGREFAKQNIPKILGKAGQLLFSPKEFYKWVSNIGTTSFFSCVHSKLIDMGENRLRLNVWMETGYSLSPAYFYISKGTMSQVPTIFGYPFCSISLRFEGNLAIYDIEYGEGIKYASVFRKIIRFPFSLWTARKDLRGAIESLQQSYYEIFEAHQSLEKKVEERTEQLRKAQEVRERIFANISHEFRTPLTLIQGPVEKMMINETKHEIQDQYRLILNNTNQLLTLVNQLLDLSKMESGSMNLNFEVKDILEIISYCTASYESSAVEKGIHFSTNLPKQPVIGLFDANCIQKILNNLLSNAFKFTDKGGDIKVSLKAADSFIYISILDTGIGIPAEKLDKIFDRFYQVESDKKRAYEGTGIGLAHTKELIDLLKGEISVTSNQGRGTEFLIRFPYTYAEVMDHEIKTETKFINLPLNSNTVFSFNEFEYKEDTTKDLLLLIEDNNSMRKFIKSVLGEYYEIIEAVDGEEGISKAYEHIPTLIISDVMMPKMSGYELCKIIKLDERTSHIPVILLTAKGNQESKLEGLEIGADDYIVKPFNSKELLVRINNIIEQRKKLREKLTKEGLIRLDLASVSSLEKNFIKKVKDVIEKNIANEYFTVEHLSAEVALSRVQLHRKLKALTNQSAGEIILMVRLQRAADLIKQNAASISEIAFMTGFNTQSYFGKCFKKAYGCSPSEYKGKILSS